MSTHGTRSRKKKLKHIHFLFSDFCSFLFQFLQVPSFSRITLFIFYYYYTPGQFSCNLVRHFNLFLLFVAALYVCSIGNIYVFSQISCLFVLIKSYKHYLIIRPPIASRNDDLSAIPFSCKVVAFSSSRSAHKGHQIYLCKKHYKLNAVFSRIYANHKARVPFPI